MDEILEHEILKTLFVRNGVHLGETQRAGEKTVPIHKREFSDYSLHYGTLVDILNSPDKYSQSMNSLRGVKVFDQDVTTNKFSWGEVSNAIEILILTGHVIDTVSLDRSQRIITLTPRGAIDYRMNFYHKEKDKELAIERNYKIQKKELWLKTNYWRIEILKYIIGGIIGGTIALAASHIGKLLGQQLEKKAPQKSVLVSSLKK